MLRKEIYQLPELPLVLPEFELGLFQVVNVGIRSIPVDNVARFVAQWLSPKQEPSIHSVESTQPSLDFARLARGQKSEPLVCYFLQVFRVNGILPSPAADRFRGQAGIVVPSPIPKFSCTIWRTTPRECRDRVDDLAELGLGLFDFLVRLLESGARAVTLNSDQCHMRRSLDQLEIGGTWSAGLQIVHPKGAEHLLVCGE